MNSVDKWRRDADRMLSAPVERKRNINSITGRVEDRFEAILNARRRGMPWAQIALALETDGPVSADAVESAFKRICNELGVVPPRMRKPSSSANKASQKPVTCGGETASAGQATLFDRPQKRWVDDGD